MRIVQEQGIEAQTIGILTKCDEMADTAIRTQLVPRLLGSAKDSVPLPLGWLVTMNAPIENAAEAEPTPPSSLSLPHTHSLEAQARRESSWLEGHVVSAATAEADGIAETVRAHCGCNHLIAVMKDAFYEYMRTQWAPMMIARLSQEESRAHARQTALGLPPAHMQLTQSSAASVREAALEAAMQILGGAQAVASTQNALDQLRVGLPSRARSSSLSWLPQPKKRSSTVQQGFDQMREHAESMANTMQASHRSVNAAIVAALREDASGVKLGRFPQLIAAFSRRMDEHAQQAAADYMALVLSGHLPSVAKVIHQAADEVDRCDGWNETAAVMDERRQLDHVLELLPKAKEHIATLLQVSVTSLEEIAATLVAEGGAHTIDRRGRKWEMPASARETYSGWMSKRGGFLGVSMQRRFFRLLRMGDGRSRLYYFETDREATSPNGYIDLDRVSEIARLKPNDAKSFAFALREKPSIGTVPDKERERVLDPGNQAHWEAWDAKLRDAMQPESATVIQDVGSDSVASN